MSPSQLLSISRRTSMSQFTRSALALAASLSLAMASAALASPPPRDGGPGARDGRPAPHHRSQPQRTQPQHHRAQPQQHKGPPAPHRDDHHRSSHSTRNAVAAGVAAGAILFGLVELSRSSQQSSGSTYYQQQAPATLYQSQGSQIVRYVYWCEEPQGYYPDVRACPTGWRQVPAK